MPCTEAYKEHIMYTFNGFCKTVIRYAALNAWRDRSRRRQKEISLYSNQFYKLYVIPGRSFYSHYTPSALSLINNITAPFLHCILVSVCIDMSETVVLPPFCQIHFLLYCSHILLPSNPTSRWTPLPPAISFPLPGRFGTFTRCKRAPSGSLNHGMPH